MKNLITHSIILITFIFLNGCSGTQHSRHVTNTDRFDVPVRKKTPVQIKGEVTIPAREASGTTQVFTDEPSAFTWDWQDASTTVEIEPREVGSDLRRPATVNVKTSIRPKTIPVVLRDTIELIDTVEVMILRTPGVDSFFVLVADSSQFVYTASNDYVCAQTIISWYRDPWKLWGVVGSILMMLLLFYFAENGKKK